MERLKVVSAEKKKTNKWLAVQLGIVPSIVSKWCTNVCQLSLGTHLQNLYVFRWEVQKLLSEPFTLILR